MQADPCKKPANARSGREKDFQYAAENYLAAMGFSRRTRRGIENSKKGRYYVHMHKAPQNPLMLDLLLLDAERGKYLEIELKVATGRVTKEQRTLVLRGHGVLCWNIDQLMQAVGNWMIQNERGI